MRAPSLRPYTMDVQPVSEGRAFLARAFSFLCLAEWQHLPAEVEEALRPETRHKAAEELKRDVALAVQTIGGLFLKGHVETYARTFGGGAPMKLPRAAWELDDFVPRFAASALDPRNPFDPSCPPTHWIFVDSEQFDVVLGRAGPTQVITPKAPDLVQVEEKPASEPVSPPGRFLRLPEVVAMVGLSKSTLYDRMRDGRFPKNVELGANVVVWREEDVRSWMSGQGTAPLG